MRPCRYFIGKIKKTLAIWDGLDMRFFGFFFSLAQSADGSNNSGLTKNHFWQSGIITYNKCRQGLHKGKGFSLFLLK